MDVADVLIDLFDRIRDLVPTTVEGLRDGQLTVRPEGPNGRPGNSIAWLVWHLSRVQDDHIAGVAGTQQVWFDGWKDRFALDLPDDGIGYGHDSNQVAQVRASAELLTAYHAAVADACAQFVGELGASDLDRVVDKDYDPPVTLGVRLSSVVADCLQHAGQAAYVRGLLTD